MDAKGAKMSVLGTYGKLNRKESLEECPVCLDEFSKESVIVNLACKHFFHPTCVNTLKNCPNCRAEIIRSDGFYLYWLGFLEEQWPNQRGGWIDEEFGELGSQLSALLNAHEEWTDFIPISSYTELKKLFSDESTELEVRSPDLEWKELLFKEFVERPEIKSIFQEIAGRFLAKKRKEQKVKMLFRAFLSKEEKNVLSAAEKLHPRPSFFEKCFPQFNPHQE